MAAVASAEVPESHAATRTLHVAALPFPTRQGTQAAIAAMLGTLSAAGRDAQLLSYAHGVPEPAATFKVHRGSGWSGDRSLRSGPSARKLIADLELATMLDRTRRRAGAQLVIAHHVEAALLCTRTPHVFFAHTDLGAELPSYGPAQLGSVLGTAGDALDRLLIRRAGAVAAISPLLAERLALLAADRPARVAYVPVPWILPPPLERDARVRARRELGLAPGTQVVAYAGNLDAYQGWEALVGAVSQLNARFAALTLLVATASDPRPLVEVARHAGVSVQLRIASLADEAARRNLHAAADVIAVPRRTPGGLPIKLLDALARGAPCVVARSARAGLLLDGVAHVAEDDDASALAAAIGALLTDRDRAGALGAAGRRFIAREHSPAAFMNAFDTLCRQVVR